MKSTMKLPAFAQEDYYLNKKAAEANELFKQATSCGEDGISCMEYNVWPSAKNQLPTGVKTREFVETQAHS